MLGPLEVRREGTVVPIPGGKTTEVLARLALEAGSLVRAERIVDDVWADAPATRRNTLQSKVTKLRRALGEPSAIRSRDDGYVLEIDPAHVDALVVVLDAAAAARLLDDGDARGAADLSAAALGRFRGDVLPAAGDGEWVAPFRARLDAARLALVETGFAARLRLGHDAEIIGELDAAVATWPFQEGLWELLITALYRVGRQADALATYQRVRRQLADELGLDPGPALQLLEQRILVHDESLGIRERAAAPLPLDAPRSNLPSLSVPLVGRDDELDTVAELLSHARLVEILGPGGIGKTALAVEVGRRLSAAGDAGPGGVWLARLESAATADEVVDMLIAALTVTGGESALFERLKGAATLVILDNCEHVVDQAAALVERLLDAAPLLRVLCTSQVPLDVDGEARFELAPLPLPDAVALFTQRAGALRTRLEAPDADDAVHELCRSLDGLPLAIELAAARTKTLSIEDITRRLDDRFHVLHDPTSRRPERRRALKATIGWSYDLLFPDDQRGLWALATFAGGAPLPAVESVLEALDVPASAAIDVVGRLASRSLVIVDDDDGPTPTVRYRLLDSIRAFSLEAMTEAGLTPPALAAHAAWYRGAAADSTAGVRSRDQGAHLAFARAERANIEAALAWSSDHDPQVALDIVNGFGWAWVVLGDSRGAQRILGALAAAGDAAPARDRAQALLLAAWLEASTGHLELAHEHVALAAALADGIGDVDLQARALCYLAYVVSHEGEFAAALAATDRADALYAGLDRPWDQAANWLFAARAAISAGDLDRSVDARDQVQHWLEQVDDPWLHVRGEAMLGELARVQHRFDDAVQHIGRAAETSRELGFLQTEAYQVSSLGRAQCQAGDYDTGAATLAVAVEKAEATGDVRLAALARVHLGRVLRALGDDARARTVLAQAFEWHRAAGGGEQAALGECLLAAVDSAAGSDQAPDRLRAVLGDARRDDEAHVEVFALDALARRAAVDGDLDTARDLCAAADRRMEAVSHFISERDRVDAHAVRALA